MTEPHVLLGHLADGRFHSGEDLAAAFGVSRTAIWKQLQQLRQLPGVHLHAVRGRGYRLAHPLELLDDQRLRQHLGAQPPVTVELLQQVDSTNGYLMARVPPAIGQGHACIAEHQTAGRGRHGRPWMSGYGRNLALSLAWTFDLPMMQLAGISLAAGVAVADALHAVGLRGHGLKWPNDLYLDGRKLAGILVEASGEAGGPTRVVIGVGINLRVDDETAAGIDQPWTDVVEQLGPCPPRNRIAGQVLAELAAACQRYREHGIAPFLAAWQRHDVHLGRDVEVRLGEQVISGRYVGLSEEGNLLLETAAGRRSFAGGEVSLRPMEAR